MPSKVVAWNGLEKPGFVPYICALQKNNYGIIGR